MLHAVVLSMSIYLDHNPTARLPVARRTLLSEDRPAASSLAILSASLDDVPLQIHNDL